MIDISNPTSPEVVAALETPTNAYGVAVSDDYAYVTDMFWGLLVIDISIPTSPQRARGADTPGVPYGVTVAGDYVYVADWTSGLQVLHRQCQ